jgi:hypothetical protein
MGDIKLLHPIEPSGAYLRWGKDTGEDLPGTFAKLDQILISQKPLFSNDLAMWQLNTSTVLRPHVQITEAVPFNRMDAQEVRHALLQKNAGNALKNEQEYLMSLQVPSEQVHAKTKEQGSVENHSRLNHLRDVATKK